MESHPDLQATKGAKRKETSKSKKGKTKKLSNMETNPAMIGVAVLDQDNYLDWSVQAKTYLKAQDLWDIVKSRSKPPTPNKKAKFKAWSTTNAMALHVIQMLCGPDAFSDIRKISSAKIAWDTLAEKYKTKKDHDPSSSITSAILGEDELSDSSTNSGESDDEGYINDSFEDYVDFYKVLQTGDWPAVNEFLDHNPGARNAEITVTGRTPLHVAVAAGHVDIVEKLLNQMPATDLKKLDNKGHTALARTAHNGNCRIAELLLEKDENLIRIGNHKGKIPVFLAIYNGYVELARYLYLRTPLEILTQEDGSTGASLLCEAIYNKALDIALDLAQRCPRLIVSRGRDGDSPLYALACMHSAFQSGNRLVFWKQWIYSSIHIQLAHPTHPTTNSEIRLNIEERVKNQDNDKKFIGSGLFSLGQVVSNLHALLGIKDLYEMKLAHFLSSELLSCMRNKIQESNTQEKKTSRVIRAILCAVEEGFFEFVFEMVKADPQLVWSHNKKSRSIFTVAVKYRRANIYSLIYGLDMKNALTSSSDRSGNNLLHMAGMSADSTLLNDIPGAALQMQRELQWFKEVESIVPPWVHRALNKEKLTPRQLFTEKHADMMSKGEKWMKDTASSCTVVGALIVTIMFAAAFTIPGGNDQTKGFPIFLNEKLFMLFIVSDALSLFSSSTSVLMFLGILTSHYAEEDFLKSLPKKMIIGLSTLFFSIATMMTAFSAALLLMLRGQSWIFLPVICLASVPVTLFVLMQFPLLVNMTISTYGPGMFKRKMKRWF